MPTRPENATAKRPPKLRVRFVSRSDASASETSRKPSQEASRTDRKRKAGSRPAKTENATGESQTVADGNGPVPGLGRMHDPRSLRLGERIRNALTFIRLGSSVDSAFASVGIGRKRLRRLVSGETSAAKRLRQSIADASALPTATAEIEVRQSKPLDWLRAQRERPATRTQWNERQTVDGSGGALPSQPAVQVQVIGGELMRRMMGVASEIGLIDAPPSTAEKAGASDPDRPALTIGNRQAEPSKSAVVPGRVLRSEQVDRPPIEAENATAARRFEGQAAGGDYDIDGTHEAPHEPPKGNVTPPASSEGSLAAEIFSGSTEGVSNERGAGFAGLRQRMREAVNEAAKKVAEERERQVGEAEKWAEAVLSGTQPGTKGAKSAEGGPISPGGSQSYTSKSTSSLQEGERGRPGFSGPVTIDREGRASFGEKVMTIAEKVEKLSMGIRVVCDECGVGEVRRKSNGDVYCSNCEATGRLAYKIGEEDAVPKSVRDRAKAQVGKRTKFPKLTNRANPKKDADESGANDEYEDA